MEEAPEQWNLSEVNTVELEDGEICLLAEQVESIGQ
jgi:hypothetical protein